MRGAGSSYGILGRTGGKALPNLPPPCRPGFFHGVDVFPGLPIERMLGAPEVKALFGGKGAPPIGKLILEEAVKSFELNSRVDVHGGFSSSTRLRVSRPKGQSQLTSASGTMESGSRAPGRSRTGARLAMVDSQSLHPGR